MTTLLARIYSSNCRGCYRTSLHGRSPSLRHFKGRLATLDVSALRTFKHCFFYLEPFLIRNLCLCYHNYFGCISQPVYADSFSRSCHMTYITWRWRKLWDIGWPLQCKILAKPALKSAFRSILSRDWTGTMNNRRGTKRCHQTTRCNSSSGEQPTVTANGRGIAPSLLHDGSDRVHTSTLCYT